jgi:PAS domain S-box-containing protein
MDNQQEWNDLRNKIIGLGEQSTRKSYYPELQKKVEELQRFKKLFDRSNDLIIQANATSSKIVDINQSVCKALKYTDDELKQLSLHDVFVDDFSEILRHNFFDTKTGLPDEQKMVRKDGSELYVSLSIFVAEYDNEVYYVLIARDISDKIHAGQVLKDTEAYMLGIFNNISDAIFVHKKDGSIIDVNDAMLRMFQVRREDALTYTIQDYSSSENSFQDILNLWQSVIDGQEQIFEWHARRPYDNSLLDVEVALRRMHIFGQEGIIAVVRDITERKRREQEAIFQATLVHAQYETSPDGIIVTDANGKTRLINPKFRQYCKLDGNNLLEQNACELFSGFSQGLVNSKTFNELIQNLLFDPEKKTKKEYKIEGPKYFEFYSVPLISITETFLGRVFYIRDLTEQKMKEWALRRATEFTQMINRNLYSLIITLDRRGKIVQFNPSCVKLTGYTEDEAKGKYVWELLIPEENRQKVKDNFDKIIQGDYPNYFENEWLTKSGEIRWITWANSVLLDDEGKIEFIIGSGIDITDRQKAEIALKESEELYMSVVDEAPLHIFRLNKNCEIVFANQSFLNLLRCDLPQLVGRVISDFYPKELAEKFYNEDMSIMAEDKRVQNFEKLIDPITKIEHSYETFKIPLHDNDGNVVGLQCVMLDLTDLIQTQDALKTSEARLQTAMKNLPFDFWLCDKSGKYLMQNEISKNTWGDLIGRVPADIAVSPEIRAIWLDNNRRALSGQIVTCEREAVIKGKLVNYLEIVAPVYRDNLITGILGVNIDISDKKQAQKNFVKSEERYRALVEIVGEGIIVQDASYNILTWNKTSEVIFGVSFEEMKKGSKNRTNWTMFDEAGHEISIDKTPSIISLSTGKPISDFIARVVRHDGVNFWIAINCRPMFYNNETAPYAVALSFSDITRQKKIEAKLLENEILLRQQNEEFLALNEELSESNIRIQEINDQLIRAKDKAEESDRLKSAFLANMSHEIRTPLNAIMGFSELLETVDIAEEKRKSYLHIIHQRSNDLLNIINDILDVSKIESGLLKIVECHVSVSTILDEIFELFENRRDYEVPKPVQLRQKNYIGKSQSIVTDPVRLKQVLINLVGNALKFTESGFVEIGCKLDEHDELQFWVADSGIGISSEKLSIIFERFRQAEETLDRKYGGTGLGLSISKGILDLMNGKIWVESQVGVGTTFFFTIPFVPSSVDANTELPVFTDSYNWEKMSILVIEDDEYNMDYLSELLKSTNVRLWYADDAISAIEIYEKQPSIQLILLDVRLPDMSGFELAGIIKRINPECHIIAQTAFASEEDKKQCFAAGCDDYITKPINRKKILRLIDKYFLETFKE